MRPTIIRGCRKYLHEDEGEQGQEGEMIVSRLFGKAGRGLAVAAAILVAIGLTTLPRPADAGGGWSGGGISPGAAVGIGLGAFALGSVLANPYYYNPYYYPYGYYGYYPQAPAYYPPASYYPPARTCWSPSYGYYYAC
jgi:hypothetical protein